MYRKSYNDAMAVHLQMSQITDEFIFRKISEDTSFAEMGFLQILYFLGDGEMSVVDFKKYQEQLWNDKSKAAFDTWTSKYLRKLKKKNLINVARSETDKRNKIISLSTKGRNVIKKYIEYSRKRWSELANANTKTHIEKEAKNAK